MEDEKSSELGKGEKVGRREADSGGIQAGSGNDAAETGRQRGLCGKTSMRSRQSNPAIGHMSSERSVQPSKAEQPRPQAVIRQQRGRAGAGARRKQRQKASTTMERDRKVVGTWP